MYIQVLNSDLTMQTTGQVTITAGGMNSDFAIVKRPVWQDYNRSSLTSFISAWKTYHGSISATMNIQATGKGDTKGKCASRLISPFACIHSSQAENVEIMYEKTLDELLSLSDDEQLKLMKSDFMYIDSNEALDFLHRGVPHLNDISSIEFQSFVKSYQNWKMYLGDEVKIPSLKYKRAILSKMPFALQNRLCVDVEDIKDIDELLVMIRKSVKILERAQRVLATGSAIEQEKTNTTTTTRTPTINTTSSPNDNTAEFYFDTQQRKPKFDQNGVLISHGDACSKCNRYYHSIKHCKSNDDNNNRNSKKYNNNNNNSNNNNKPYNKYHVTPVITEQQQEQAKVSKSRAIVAVDPNSGKTVSREPEYCDVMFRNNTDVRPIAIAPGTNCKVIPDTGSGDSFVNKDVAIKLMMSESCDMTNQYKEFLLPDGSSMESITHIQLNAYQPLKPDMTKVITLNVIDDLIDPIILGRQDCMDLGLVSKKVP